MYSAGFLVKLRVILSTSGSGYEAAENSSWYGLIPVSPMPMITNGDVFAATASASATVTPTVRRTSNPALVTTLNVARCVPRARSAVAFVPGVS